MTRTWTFDLPYARPPKGLAANDRAHWRTKNRSTQDVRISVKLAAAVLKIPAMERVKVQIVWVVADRRKRDSDGPDPLCKAIYDGLGSDRGTSAQIVPDDDPAHMEKPRLVIEHRPTATPHFEVTITEMDTP